MSRDVQPSSFGLRSIALLEGLSHDRLESLAHDCAWRLYGAAQEIITRDAHDDSVYLIVSGRVRVTTYSTSGRQVTLRDIAAGEHFGELSAIDGMRRSADVLAVESSLLASMRPEVFWKLLREEPLVSARVLKGLASLVRRLSDRVLDLSTLGVSQRVRTELLRLAREAGMADNTARIEPIPRYADIAGLVSTSREQVTRECMALMKAGILERVGHSLVVRDIARLERLIEEDREHGGGHHH